MTFLILHGIGGHSGIHWQNWLKGELEAKQQTVLMPELPDSDDPDRNTWFNTIKDTVKNVELSDLVIIGHSLGVTAALDFIEQTDKPVRGLVSVSGFAHPYGAELNEAYLQEMVIDFAKVVGNIEESAVIYGNDDPYVTQEVLMELAQKLGVTPTIIANGGHLNTETGYTTFALLMNTITDTFLSGGSYGATDY